MGTEQVVWTEYITGAERKVQSVSYSVLSGCPNRRSATSNTYLPVPLTPELGSPRRHLISDIYARRTT